MFTLEGSPRYTSGSCAICTGPSSYYYCTGQKSSRQQFFEIIALKTAGKLRRK